MRIGTIAICVSALLIPALPATAASASSTVILLNFTVGSLPDGVFIDEDLTGDLSTFCLPPIGVGFCLPPDFSNNLGPGINPGGPLNNPGPPYEFSWSGESSFAEAPPGNLSEYGTLNQTNIPFRNTTDIIRVVAVSWSLTYRLETEGVTSRAAISTDIAQQDIPSHIIFDPQHPIWPGDSVSNGADKLGGFMTGHSPSRYSR